LTDVIENDSENDIESDTSSGIVIRLDQSSGNMTSFWTNYDF